MPLPNAPLAGEGEFSRAEIRDFMSRTLGHISHSNRKRRRISVDEMPPSFLYRDLDRSMMARNLSLALRETVSASALRTGTTAASGFPFFMTTIVSFFAFRAYSDSGAQAFVISIFFIIPQCLVRSEPSLAP